MRRWFFDGHVAVAAKYADEIAWKVGADREVAVLASLFHDIARTWGTQRDPALMNESIKYARRLMGQTGYSKQKIEAVVQAILPHSCRRGLPHTKEGKVLATADALAHLMTDFYFIMPFNGWLTAARTFEGYRTWLLEKIERDYKRKICFKQYQRIARPRYQALKTLFKR